MYCLLVLRTIRRADELGFVPHVCVSIGLLLATVSIGVLIYFIHHVSASIQADEVVARVGRELADGLRVLYPRQLGKSGSNCPQSPREDLPTTYACEADPVAAPDDGYLQLIDADALMALATAEDLVLRLEHRPGHYLVKGQTMVMVWPRRRVTEALRRRLSDTFVFGNQRIGAQDVETSFQQLVEIAVRALSPGINDPFTAIVCVDRLSSALCRLARSDMPSARRFDAQGRLRLVAPGSTFGGILNTAFNQIRQNARSIPAVAIRMLDAIVQIAGHVRNAEDAASLRRHAEMIFRGAQAAVPEAQDLLDIEARYTAATQALLQSALANRPMRAD
jgi:uncharacterized membrane protein